MDPNTPNNPNSTFELPEPVKGSKNTPPASSEVLPNKLEKSENINMELPGSSPMVNITGAQSTAQPTTLNVGQNEPPSSLSSSSVTPALADDVDLIEKEWVQKAKAIVAHTSADPHVQNKELNKVKADYIKKRYNKEVKLGEE